MKTFHDQHKNGLEARRRPWTAAALCRFQNAIQTIQKNPELRSSGFTVAL